MLTRWNQQRVDTNSDDLYDDPAVTIFNTWYSTFTTKNVTATLGPDYQTGQIAENVTPNIALRLLQTGRNAHHGLPLTADYLHGTPIDTATTDSLITALDQLTTNFHATDPAAWLTPAATIQWAPLGAGTVPATPFMNRGTYNQILDLGPSAHGENVVAPGQSGDPRSPHFADQLGLYATWRYKPMHLTDYDINNHTTTTESIPVTT